MKITLSRELQESEYAVKAFKASRSMQIEAAAILKIAVHRLEDLSDRHTDEGGYINHDRATQLSIGFHNYLMSALRKLEPRPMVLRQVKHYDVAVIVNANIVANVSTRHTSRYRHPHDSLWQKIALGDPIGAPSGSQLSTEAESDIERDRR